MNSNQSRNQKIKSAEKVADADVYHLYLHRMSVVMRMRMSEDNR